MCHFFVTVDILLDIKTPDVQTIGHLESLGANPRELDEDGLTCYAIAIRDFDFLAKFKEKMEPKNLKTWVNRPRDFMPLHYAVDKLEGIQNTNICKNKSNTITHQKHI